MRGYPIRTPSDHSSVDSSPRLIAASHVLHRLLVPRHPPCALKNLHTKTKKKDARVHYADLKQQTHNQQNAGQPRNKTQAVPTQPAERRNKHQSMTSPFPQDPTAHPRPPTTTHRPFQPTKSRTRHSTQPPATAIVSVPPMSNTAAEHMPTKRRLDRLINDQPARKLLRKEVIQPHLPVRLPCYDFVPIADPTFDSSLPTRGLSHWLRVLPTFVT